ncbi:MAG TPA: ribonuclease T2 [Roseiarcus sp.]
MRLGRTLALALAAAALAATASPSPASAQDAAGFDYYVFTLSWSPGFCDTGGAEKSPTQCAAGAGSGFVVHGLWPDRARGPNPENCQYGAHISAAAVALTEGVYPDEGLARYEYLKHGSCSGLDPEDYFGAVKTLRDGVVVPDILKAPHAALTLAPSAIEQAFVAANANLQPANMAVTCRNGEFVDVRLCVSKDLHAFANCPKVAGHTCHASSITVAPLR